MGVFALQARRRWNAAPPVFSIWRGLQGGDITSQRGSIVSDEVKYEIATELGFADRIQVQNGSYDYSNITTREAGLIVRGLIQKAEELLSRRG